MSRYTFTEDEIKQVEEILINWRRFCSERRTILEDFDNNIDVQAVPWSWKTTLLVAKLFLLAQRINFGKESVCILTHTNVAVDEIKKKVKKAKLNNNVEKSFIDNIERILKFPNYIWTLQSFIDRYLAIPWYVKEYWKKPNRIDDDYVNSILKKLFYEKLSSDTRKWISLVYNTRRWYQVQNNNAWIARLSKTYLRLKDWAPNLFFWKINQYWKININTPPTTKLQKNRYDNLLNIKLEQVVNDWYLTFQEANYFAENYFNNYNLLIRKFLQNRFKFVFLDEIQDTNWIHINLLNQIFKDSSCLIQWFWDKNQAILEWDNDELYKFMLFDKEEEIKSSRRLSKEIANWVWKCSINPLELEWIEERNIPIYFYVYDNSSKDDLLKFYKEKIAEHEEKFIEISIKDRVFKIIWRTHNWIQEYIPDYEWKEKAKKDYFLDYFQKANDLEFQKEWFKIYKDSILEAIIRFCNISWIKNWDKWFSKTTFLKYLKDNNEEYLKKLLSNIYIWSRKINDSLFLSHESDNKIKELLWEFEKDWKRLDFTNNFYNTSRSYPIISPPEEEWWWQISSENLSFEYWSIHWVKWETHTWTLILDIKSNKLSNSVILKYINDEKPKDLTHNDFNKIDKKTWKYKWRMIKDSIKLYYVWMTRATHLLVIWINKSLCNQKDIDLLYSNVNNDNIFFFKNICIQFKNNKRKYE